MWLEDATGTTYIGSRDKYYIDDYGNLQEYSESEAASSSGDSSEEYSKSEKRGELHMRVDSLLMIRSENPCLKKKVISSNVP